MKQSTVIPYYYGIEGNWSFVLKEKSSSLKHILLIDWKKINPNKQKNPKQNQAQKPLRVCE